jgi:hypothetical protein
MGEATYIKNQYGKEVTKGTSVVATRIFPGEVKLPKDRTPVKVRFMDGTRLPAHKKSINQIHVDGIRLTMPVGVFQGLPMLFSITLKGGVTATEVTTSQADYLWDFTPSWTATNAPDAITLETGDNTQAYEVEYVMGRRIKISGKIGDDGFIAVECDAFGKQITPTTFTASQALPGQELMLGNMVKLYIDPLFANAGATEKTGLLKEFSLEIMVGNHAKFLAGGSKMMSSHGEGIVDAILTLTMEGNTDADANFDLYQAGTEKAVRIEILGSQIGTGTVHSAKFDLFGSFDEVIPLGGEDNGNNLHTAIFSINSNRLSTQAALGVKVTTNINAI